MAYARAPGIHRPHWLALGTCALAVVLSTALLAPRSAHAYKVEKTSIDSTQDRMSLSPAQAYVEVDPGEQLTRPLTISNHTAEQFSVTISTKNLAAARSTESLARPVLEAQRGAAEWLTPEVTRLRMTPGDQVTLSIAISVPEDAAPGAWAAAVVVTRSLQGASNETAVRIGASLGSQLLLEVSGDARTSAKVAAGKGPRFVQRGDDVHFRAMLENTGDTIIAGTGHAEVDAFLMTAEQQLRFAATPVLPGGKRKISVRWRDIPLFGVHHPRFEVTAGGTRHVEELPRVIVLPPWWMLVLIGAVAATAVALGVALFRYRKKAGD